MPERPKCPECGTELPCGAPQGLCPRCLLAMGIDLVSAAAVASSPLPSPAPTGDLNPKTKSSTVRYFGDYELLEEIARGGMGVVYKARQVSLNRLVAVKMLLFGRFSSDEFVKRFHAEAEAVASLKHPNIVAIHEIGEHEGQHYFSMDFVEGQDLATRARDNPLPPELAADYVRTIARAVHYAHEHGVLHRDLKPSNILIDSADQSHVTDFGLAKRLRGDSELTTPGEVLGTPTFMAPEQAAGRQAEVASDVYSLGAILFYLLTGRPPFLAEYFEEMLTQVLNVEPLAPRSLNPKVPPDLETICLKCLNKTPNGRYKTASSLAEDLQHWLEGTPIEARPINRVEKLWRWTQRNPIVSLLAAGIVVLLLLVAIGSSIAALRFKRANVAIQNAENEALEKLRAAYLAEAHAKRTSGRPGQRFESLAAVTKAAAIRRDLDVRNEAIACLAVPDMRLLRQSKAHSFNSEPRVRFSPDLEMYAVEEAQGDVLIRASDDDHEIARLPSSGTTMNWLLGFSHDARYLAASYADNNIRVWDIRERRAILKDLPGYQAGDFSPDDRVFALSTADGDLRFQALSGQSAVRKVSVKKRFSMISFNPAGTWLACAVSSEPTVEIRDVESGGIVGTCQLGAPATFLAWSADGVQLASGCWDSRVYVWESSDWHKTAMLEGHGEPTMGVAFSHNGNLLASASWDDSTRLWRLETGREIMRCVGWGTQIQFAQDDLRLGYVQRGSKFGVVAIAQSVEYSLFFPHKRTRGHSGPDFSPDGSMLAAGSDERVWFWDARSGREIGSVEAGGCDALIVHPNGKTFITAEKTGVYGRPIERAQTNSSLAYKLGRPQRIFGAPDLREVALSLDGRHLAVVANHQLGETLVLDLEDPAAVVHLGNHPLVDYVAISPDAKWAATASFQNPVVKVWNATSGQLVKTLPMPSRARLVFSPDGHWLATSTIEYQLWEVGSWQAKNPAVSGYPMPHLNCIAFSPDAALMAVTQEGGYILLLETATGRPLGRLEAPDGDRIAAMHFAPDGTALAALEWNQQLQFWNLRNIRTQLKRLGLDWNMPDYPERQTPGPPTTVTLELQTDEDFAPFATRELARFISRRDTAAPTNLIDLSAYYNVPLTSGSGQALRHAYLNELPRGIRELAGVQFDVRGLIQLASSPDEHYPTHIAINMNRTCKRLHFLQGALFLSGTRNEHPFGTCIINYTSGRQTEVSTIGLDSDAATAPEFSTNNRSVAIAWTSEKAESMRVGVAAPLFRITWENQSPDELIKDIDFAALPGTAPFLIAITAE